MNKKIEKMVSNIVKAAPKNFDVQVTDGKTVYATDHHRVVKTNHVFDSLPVKADQDHFKLIDRVFSQFLELNYKLTPLPSIDVIKKGIIDLCGRKRTKVCYGNDRFCVDARWLREAMEALNATVCWCCGAMNKPILLYENDDMHSGTAVLIMPVVGHGLPAEGKFWIPLAFQNG